jgi:uncharacterized FlgJ-related protein
MHAKNSESDTTDSNLTAKINAIFLSRVTTKTCGLIYLHKRNAVCQFHRIVDTPAPVV